ncbi:hypothetical protein [Cellulomonas flavigena]|uniref:hypothetical protein n=1 Tax=Cellulomonas flavigena TaxID=1711 RepID=UPI000310721F|nr:hypothetical protein [Cellulomonas flavigena]
MLGLQQAVGNKQVAALLAGGRGTAAGDRPPATPDAVPARPPDAATVPGPTRRPGADAGGHLDGEPVVDLGGVADRPDLAAPAARIQQAALAEQAVVRTTAATLRAQVDADVLARAAEVRTRTATEVSALGGLVAGRKAEVSQRARAATGALEAVTAAQSARARASAGPARQQLQQRVTAKRGEATRAATEQANLAQDGGAQQSQRAVETSAEIEGRITATARQKAAAYPGDADVRDAVHEAVTGTAHEVAADMAAKSRDLGAEARRTATELATSIRHAGADLAQELGTSTAEVERSLTDAAGTTADQISGMGSDQAVRLTAVGRQAQSALDGLRTAAVAQVQAAGRQTLDAVQATGADARSGIDHAEQDAVVELATGARSAVAALASSPGRGRPARDDLDEFGEQVSAELQGARAQTTTGLTAAADAARRQLGSHVGGLGQALDGGHGVVDAQATALLGSAGEAFDAAQSATDSATGTALAELAEAHAGATDQYVGGLDEQVRTATGTWAEQREQTVGEIETNVGDQLAGHRAAEMRAPQQLDDAAREGAEAAEASIWEQIGAGIWNAIKKFGEGLLFLLVLTLGVFGLLLALGLVVLSVKGFLIALAVAGLCLLVYAVVTGIADRWAQYRRVWGDQPWYVDIGAALGITVLSVGGAFGVTQLLEGVSGYDFVSFEGLSPQQRAERITEGVLTIATILLFRSVAKRAGPIGEGLTARGRGVVESIADLFRRPGERRPVTDEPVVDEPAVVPDAYARLGERFRLSADTVEMMRDSRADPAVLEALLSRGLDGERVALAASDHGALGLSLLDALTRAGVTEGVAMQVLQDAAALGRLPEAEALSRSGVLARLLARRGPEEVVLLVDQLGVPGVEIVDGLARTGVSDAVATDAAMIAQRIGAIAEVRQLATSGNLENPAGLRAFLREVELEVRAGQRGKLVSLQEAARRSESGRVALEQSGEARTEDGAASGADVIDHGAREALQQKVVTGASRPDAVNPVTVNLEKAASQLRGESGEVPPAGYARIADIRIENPANAMFPLERAALLEALRNDGVDAAVLRGVDRVHVTNGTGTHVYTPGEF